MSVKTWSELLTAKCWADVIKFTSEVVYNDGTLHSYLKKTGNLARLYEVTGNKTDYFQIPFAQSVNCVSYSKPEEFALAVANYCCDEPVLSMARILGGSLFCDCDKEKTHYFIDPDWDVSIPALLLATNGRAVLSNL